MVSLQDGAVVVRVSLLEDGTVVVSYHVV